MLQLNRKSLSEMIAYVLLIVIAISLALLVYAWMKGLLWKPSKDCPEGISLIVSDYSCDNALGRINITFRNNGLFDVSGFIVRISNETGRLPTKSLYDGTPIKEEDNIFYFPSNLTTGNDFTNTFSYLKYDKIIELEIVPLRLVKGELLICDKAKIKQEVGNDECG